MSSSPPPAEERRLVVGYRFHDRLTTTTPEVLWLVEDPQLVLLGGEVWPSAFAMAEYLETTLMMAEAPLLPAVVVELGAGAGLCGLVAAAAVLRAQKQQQHQQPTTDGSSGGCRVFLTDESPELAAMNADLFRKEWLRGVASGDGGDGAAAMSVEALDLPWGTDALPRPLASVLLSNPGPLLLLGCEITPMVKTQPALESTLRALLLSMPAAEHEARALLTVDACTLLGSTPEYPRVCPAAAAATAAASAAAAAGGTAMPCAGHRFLALVEAEKDLMWSVERVWTAEEVRATCRARRVRGDGGAGCGADFGAATAPEGLVLVGVRRRSEWESGV